MISLNHLEKLKPFYEKIQRGERDLFSFNSYFEGQTFSKNEKKVLARLLIESIQFKIRNRYTIELFSKKIKRKIYKNDIKFFFVSNCFFRGLPEKFDLVEERNLLTKLLKKDKFKKFFKFLNENYKGEILKLKKGNIEKYLEKNYSHPMWYIKQLLSNYNLEIAKKILNYNNYKPSLFLMNGKNNFSKEVELEDFFSLKENEREELKDSYFFSSFLEFALKNININQREKIALFTGDKIFSVPYISKKLSGKGEVSVITKNEKKTKKLIKEYDLQNVRVNGKDDVRNLEVQKLIVILKTSQSGNWRNEFHLRWIITPEKIREMVEENLKNLRFLIENIKFEEIYILSESILEMENEATIYKILREFRLKQVINNSLKECSFKSSKKGYTLLPSKFLNTSGGFISILKYKTNFIF